MVRESIVRPANFIYPLFIHEEVGMFVLAVASRLGRSIGGGRREGGTGDGGGRTGEGFGAS